MHGFCLAALLLVAGLMAPARGEDAFSTAEKAAIRSLSLAALPPLPADPSNRVADDPRAEALGATLFFEPRLSGNGAVSCGTCHDGGRQFQDDKPRSEGIGTTDRRSMPLAGAAYNAFQFWDGRRDSLWAQALVPLEQAREQGSNRAAIAHFVGKSLRARYEGIFGPLPDLATVPANASPLGSPAEQAAWAAMDEGQRAAVDGVFANVGKALAAFERQILPRPTRFDRFAEALAAGQAPSGPASLNADELAGLRLFIAEGSCIACHSGPRFTDGRFHNTGVPQAPGTAADPGRESGLRQVLADPFNCRGAFSDDPARRCLAYVAQGGTPLRGAFKTPSLRGVADRPPFMHAGQFRTLADVLDHYAQAQPASVGTSELVARRLTEDDRRALIAFLGMLTEETALSGP